MLRSNKIRLLICSCHYSNLETSNLPLCIAGVCAGSCVSRSIVGLPWLIWNPELNVHCRGFGLIWISLHWAIPAGNPNGTPELYHPTIPAPVTYRTQITDTFRRFKSGHVFPPISPAHTLISHIARAIVYLNKQIADFIGQKLHLQILHFPEPLWMTLKDTRRSGSFLHGFKNVLKPHWLSPSYSIHKSPLREKSGKPQSSRFILINTY